MSTDKPNGADETNAFAHLVGRLGKPPPFSEGWFQTLLKDTDGLRRRAIYYSCFVNLTAIAAPIFTLQVYDRVIFHAGIETLKALVIGILIVIFFDFLMRKARANLFRAVSLRNDVLVGHKMFRHTMNLPLRELEKRPTGQWIAFFNDLAAVRNRMGGPMAAQFIDVPFSLMFLVVIFVVATPIAWIPVVSGLMFLILIWRADVSVAARVSKEQEQIVNRNGLLNELLHARTTVKSLSLALPSETRWAETQGSLIEESVLRGAAHDHYQTISYSMTQLTTIAMTSVGALAIVNQSMTMGALIAANMLGGRMIANLGQTLNYWRGYQTYVASKKRLSTIFGIDTEKVRSEVAQENPQGKITFSDLSFRYEENAPLALEEASGTIGPGGFYVLVGANGSGKSTLMKLLRGLYRPEKGVVMLDDRDIRQFTNQEIARWIGYMPQDATLFSGTLHSNIIFGAEQHNDEAILESTKYANCHHIITKFPAGYETPVGEGGANISPGLRQKICLARLYLRQPSLVFLDEPTNHLDQQGVIDLASSLKLLAKTKTVLVISHNPSLLQQSDYIVVMEDGHVRQIAPKDVIAKQAAAQAQSKKAALQAPEKSQEA